MLTPIEYLYLIIAALEVFSEVSGNETLKFFTKPLLMIVLVIFYARAKQGPVNKVHRLMIAAFMFAWVGDVALMFVSNAPDGSTLMGIPKNPNFFLLGLVGFLITHILYTIAFAEVSDKNVAALLPKKFWVIGPLFIYMVALLSLLLPAIMQNAMTKPFLAPVVVYSTAIAVMVLFSINRFHRVNDRSFILVFSGALLFMFSDSLIAINKFLQPIPYAGVAIMLLYCGGQLLIAKGSLAQFQEKP